jgi:hypothetical protein
LKDDGSQNGITDGSALSQMKANHFVKQQWSNHPKDRHLHVLGSNEMDLLKKAYMEKYFQPCGPNGKLANTSDFTLSQVYKGYYSAVAAEGSLMTL